MTARGCGTGDKGFIEVTAFESSVGSPPGPASHFLLPIFRMGQDSRLTVLEEAKWVTLSKQHGCQLWLETVATLGVAFHVNGCLVKCYRSLSILMEEPLPWRIGSQDPRTQDCLSQANS